MNADPDRVGIAEPLSHRSARERHSDPFGAGRFELREEETRKAGSLEATRADLLEFVWLRQDGLFELARKAFRLRRWIVKRQDAYEAVGADEACPHYFRLHPIYWRKGVRPDRTRAGVAPCGVNVWLDLDATPYAEFERRRLRYGIPAPSLVWHTGGSKAGSVWVLWKLVTPIDVDLIEIVNRELAKLLGGDPVAFDATRFARIPLSVHGETGVQGRILDFSRERHDTGELLGALARASDLCEAKHAAEELERPAIDLPAPGAAQEGAVRRSRPSPWLPEPLEEATIRRAGAALERVPRASEYIAAMAEAPQGPYSGGAGGPYDRSAERQAIFYALHRAGLSPRQIAWYAAEVLREPRTLEDLAAGRGEWIMASINDAVRFAEEERVPRLETSDPSFLPLAEAQWRTLKVFERRAIRTGTAIEAAAEATGRDERTNYRHIAELRRAGLIRSYRTRSGGTINVLTELGQRTLSLMRRMRKGAFCPVFVASLVEGMKGLARRPKLAPRRQSPLPVYRQMSVGAWVPSFGGSSVLAHAPP